MPENSSPDPSLPADWVDWKKTRRYRPRPPVTPDLSKVLIRSSYVCLPRPVWERLGSPARVNCFFSRWDLLFVADSAGMLLSTAKYWARLPLTKQRTPRFGHLLKPGRFEFKFETTRGIDLIRVLSCSQVLIDKSMLEHWQCVVHNLSR